MPNRLFTMNKIKNKFNIQVQNSAHASFLHNKLFCYHQGTLSCSLRSWTIRYRRKRTLPRHTIKRNLGQHNVLKTPWFSVTKTRIENKMTYLSFQEWTSMHTTCFILYLQSRYRNRIESLSVLRGQQEP